MNKETMFILLHLGMDTIVFLMYGIDKLKAIFNRWRIRESTLIFASVFGIFGAIFGMLLFHHKIRKPKFRIAIPTIFIIEAVVVIWYYEKYMAGML